MDINREEEIVQEFGKNLKKIRKLHKLTLRELAHLADVDHSTVHRIERGTQMPMLDMIITLAEAMKIDPAELLAPFR